MCRVAEPVLLRFGASRIRPANSNLAAAVADKLRKHAVESGKDHDAQASRHLYRQSEAAGNGARKVASTRSNRQRPAQVFAVCCEGRNGESRGGSWRAR